MREHQGKKREKKRALMTHEADIHVGMIKESFSSFVLAKMSTYCSFLHINDGKQFKWKYL